MIDTVCPNYLSELPTDYASRLAQQYNKTISKTHKKTQGQFFTPVKLARLMASMVDVNAKHLRILDPGCGVGILSCALIEFLLLQRSIETIDLIVYETDVDIIFNTEACLNYLKDWALLKHTKLDFSIHTQDFIVDNNFSFQNFDQSYFHHNNLFDIVISNPPYFKLKGNDKRVLIAENILGKQPNIYSIFLSVAATLLKTGGELIFVIPRSFTSGYYYTAFRDYFLKKLQLEKMHIFSSRRYPFQVDNVLQETVIMKASRSEYIEHTHPVEICSSVGLTDIENSIKKTTQINKIIKFDSNQKIIHLPTNEQEESIIAVFDSWDQTLKNYNIRVSTGPVVDFRSLEFLTKRKSSLSVPLFWLNNVFKMNLIWPLSQKENIKRRSQYISCNKFSKSRLIKTQNCILLRRFSSKDDLSRLIATPIFKSDFNQYGYIGIENHLNYIYKENEEFTINELLGISALLNSLIFDIYFRTFNGNTNVSSTELRNIPMPPYHKIIEIGLRLMECNDITQSIIDTVVNEILIS